MTFDELADEMKRGGTRVSTSAISQLLGREDTDPVGSNTVLMPAINRVLGVPPPRFCEPESELEQLQDAIAERWSQMTPHERRALIALARSES